MYWTESKVFRFGVTAFSISVVSTREAAGNGYAGREVVVMHCVALATN